jgi:phosphate transport system permease protein
MNVKIPTATPDLLIREQDFLTSRLRGAHLRDFLFGKLIFLNALVAISIIFLIFVYVGKEALPIFFDREIQKEASLEKLLARQNYGSEDSPLPYVWQPVSEVPKYSVVPLFLGSLKVTLIALLFAAPLAIAAALYTAEFSSFRVREVVKPVIELLAGIPSVVLGFLALIVLASWLQGIFHFDYRLNAINAGLALGLAITPIIYTVSEDALTAVPRSYREASLALGVSPWKTARSVYLNEYSSKTSLLYRMTRLAVTNLAGVPSIVFGLFGLGFFVKFAGGNIDRWFYGGNLVFGQPAVIWAALTLAVLTLPLVILTTEDTLRSIPNDFREASMALGATKFQTIVRTVLPQALSGILTGGILAVSRGAGEVAPILFTGAAYFLPELPTKLNSQFMELGYHIYVLSTQSPNVEATKPILYSTVLVLLGLTFLLNLTTIFIRSQMRARLRRTA